jgi:hypothetical protein
MPGGDQGVRPRLVGWGRCAMYAWMPGVANTNTNFRKEERGVGKKRWRYRCLGEPESVLIC